MTDTLPDYVETRIRQRPPSAVPVVPGSTPVVAFGDVRKSSAATLGWNPSKVEFLDRRGNELVGNDRRLETLASLGIFNLAGASDGAIRKIFHACNNYFHRQPYRWFNKLDIVLRQVGASYFDDSACHLDLVQWATDPVWSKLTRSEQSRLVEDDLPFLRYQLSQAKVQFLLLNGMGIVRAYKERLGGELVESRLSGSARLRLFTGRDARGIKVVGWNINLQSSFGVSNHEIEMIGAAVRMATRRI